MNDNASRAHRFLAWPVDAALLWVAVLLFTLEAAVSSRVLDRAAKPEAATAVAVETTGEKSAPVAAALTALTSASAAAIAAPAAAPEVAQAAASPYRVVVALPPLQ